MNRSRMALQRLRRAWLVTSLAVIATATLAVGLSSPASAGVTSVTVSPATWTPGSSQAFTLTLQVSVSTSPNSWVGLWEDLGQPRTWTLSQTGSSTGAFDEATDTLTCATGVTFSSALFDGWGSGAKTNVCLLDQTSSYFEVSLRSTTVAGTGTVVISVPAGLLAAPSTVGTTVLEAFANPDPKFNFNAIVAEATPPAAESENAPPSHLQAVGLPSSGSCDAVEDADLGWGTGLSGGWAPTWGAWLNDGAGGPACTRTLLYAIDRSRWVIS